MTNIRRLAVIAALSAVSFLLLFIQIQLIPSASFLKVDLSILPVIFALTLFDLRSAYSVLLLRTLLKFLLNFEGPATWIGMPMNVIGLAVFITAFAVLWKSKQTLKNYLLAAILGTVALTLIMLVMNVIFAVPLYARFANFNIYQWPGLSTYLWAMVLPFNVIEGFLLSLIIYPVYFACKPILDRVK